MITLFVIVVIATLVLAVMRAEGMRPLGLALVGMISLVLGARTTAVFTETSVAPLVHSIVLARDNTDPATPAPAADESAAAPGQPADAGAPPADEGVSSDVGAGEAEFGEAKNPPAAAGDRADEKSAPVTSSKAGNHGAPAGDRGLELASPLKVEAITNVTYPNRNELTPNWLETKPWTKEKVTFVPVVSRLQVSEEDCKSALESEIREATDTYVNRFLKNDHASTLLNLRSRNTVPEITERFEEQVVVTAGTMYQSHALLAFDEHFRDAVSAQWGEVRAFSRLMQAGLGAAVVILLLGTMFGYFKLDTATRGYYTGRLQFAAAAAILAVIAASVLFANCVPWM